MFSDRIIWGVNMHWIEIVEWITRLILLGMLGLSVWSISIMLDRKSFFKKWKNLEAFEDIKKRIQSPNPSLDNEDPRQKYISEVKSLPIEAFDSLFISFTNELRKKGSKGLSVLGTLGSIAPFIGLLGTILGIIVSFGELSKAAVEMKGVMFSLAEALILTAVGLAVAIPAVVAFNYFNKKINIMLKDIESSKEVYKSFRVSEAAALGTHKKGS